MNKKRVLKRIWKTKSTKKEFGRLKEQKKGY
ncbi:unnamed protein product [Spirodela intermedia]|uniref:Uncharacterized protein n=1 Tax=Spirodela intermedia TaxID=51605 RepID=A0A7I8K8I7_SPIIN|nr:unnamed protein product [Spirodela intermedia]